MQRSAMIIGLTLGWATSLAACGEEERDRTPTEPSTQTTTGTTTGTPTGTTTGTTSTTTGTGGSGGGGGTTDPYGPCSSPDQCPVADSRCGSSTGTCSPPCVDSPDDCPAPTAGSNALQCVGGQCSITCSPTAPCPNDMTCQGNIMCTW